MDSSALLILIFLVILYFLPAMIAAERHHPNALPIFVLTLLLGWSLICWVVALVWSLTAIDRPPVYRTPHIPVEPSDHATIGFKMFGKKINQINK